MLTSSGALRRDEIQSIRVEIHSLLVTLRQHVLSRQMMISGPVARGEPDATQIEVIADLRSETFRPARARDFQSLLMLSHPFFGNPERLHPYLMFSDCLLTRRSSANYWVEVERPEDLRSRFEIEMVPVRSLTRSGM